MIDIDEIKRALEISKDYIEAALKKAEKGLPKSGMGYEAIGQDLDEVNEALAALSQPQAPRVDVNGKLGFFREDTGNILVLFGDDCIRVMDDEWAAELRDQLNELVIPKRVLDLSEAYTGLAQGVIKAIRAQLPGVEIKGV